MKTLKFTDETVAQIKENVLQEFVEYLSKINLAQTKKINFNKTYTSISKPSPNKIKFIITPNAYQKMLQYTLQSELEIAWHGTVEHPDETTYILKDVMLYPQTVTAATVETDQTKYEQWLEALPDETFNQLRFQGHSHVNMSTTPSITDCIYYDELTNALSAATYYIFLIINKKQNMYIEIRDLKNNILYEKTDIEILVLDENGENLLNDIEISIKENTETKKLKNYAWNNAYPNYTHNYKPSNLNSQQDIPGYFDNFYDDLEEKFTKKEKKLNKS